MATHSLEFWFDYTCPYAYLGSLDVETLAARIDAELRWCPMLLGGVFRARETPQRLFATLSPAKAAHNAADLARLAARRGVALNMPAGHPFRSVDALRATLVVAMDVRVIHGFFAAYWVHGRDLGDRAVIADVLHAAGYDAAAVLERIDDESIKQALRARTDEAIARGVFGAPSYFVDDEALYWGQDRACLIEGRFAPKVVRDESTAPPSGRTLEVYWDFSSPYAYFASTQAEGIARRTGATLVWRPMLLGGLFRAIGQADVPLATFSEARQRHTMHDLARWAQHWGVPFRFPEHFPVNSVTALRVWLALPEARRDAWRAWVFHAYWVDGRDISDPRVLAEAIGDDAVEVLARAATAEVKQALREATERAKEAGVFGAPTWVIDGRTLYWGQDRAALVEEALTWGR